MDNIKNIRKLMFSNKWIYNNKCVSEYLEKSVIREYQTM